MDRPIDDECKQDFERMWADHKLTLESLGMPREYFENLHKSSYLGGAIYAMGQELERRKADNADT